MENQEVSKDSEEWLDVIHDLSEEERATLGYICATDFRAFIATCLIDQFGYPFSPFHDYMVHLIQDGLGKRLRHVVAAPRGSGKSTVISEAAPLWLICRKQYLSLPFRDPRNKHYIVIVSNTADQAIERLSNIKIQLETNEVIQALFPGVVGQGPTWKSDYIITRAGVAVRASGIEAEIRGRRYGTIRPDWLEFDDIETLENTSSESLRNRIRDRFNRDYLKAIDPERADVIVVGTIISKYALLYALLHDPEYSTWEGKVFKTIISWPERMDLWDRFGEIYKDRRNPNRFDDAKQFYLAHKEEMDKGAKILWPQRFTLLDVMIEYYSIGRRNFLLEMQNEVKEDYERVFEVDKYYYYDESEFESIPPARLLYYMYVDPATGKRKGRTRKTSTDMFAVVVLAKDIRTNIYYVVDCFADIIPPNKQFEIIRRLIETYPIFRFYIESNTSQYYYFESLRDWLHEKGIYRPLPRPDINRQNKEKRIEALTPYLENWTLRLNPRHRKLIQQLEDFPNAEFDDLIDCLSSCFFKAHRTFRPIFA